jgi:SAM-dependent methyltransferase
MHETLSERSVAAMAQQTLGPKYVGDMQSQPSDQTENERRTDPEKASLQEFTGTGLSAGQTDGGTRLWRQPLPGEVIIGHSRRPAETSQAARQSTADVLHVGCGLYSREKLPPVFQAGWREIRLDIDPDVRPDFVASITDMQVIPDGAMDAVYSSHNVEHLYPHEVPLALREMRRVLRPAGFAFIMLPDLQEVARHVAEGKLEDPLYISPMGPITPLDIFYGHRPSLERGNLFMAHRTGFTGETLGAALIRAGFAAVMVQRDVPTFCLTAIAFRDHPEKEQVTKAQARMLPAADRPAVLYTMAG